MARWAWRAAIGLGVVLGGILIWRWSGQGPPAREHLGGPLFAFAADDVAALEMRRRQGTSRLQREADGRWTLTGLVADLVDQERAEAAIARLAAGEGFPQIAGTRPDERRFGFGGEDALELVFHLRGGGRHRLALGDHNPVTDQFYASGAGRTGVFGVGGLLYAAAIRLPDSIRLRTLLPPLRTSGLDSLRLQRRGDAPLVLARLADRRWWLRLPGGTDALVGKAARYHATYRDRRRDEGGAAWLLADPDRLGDLVYQASETAVIFFPAPDALTPEDRLAYGLQPPLRALDLWGSDGTVWRLEFGEEQDMGRPAVPVSRQGTLVVSRHDALLPLLEPLSAYLDLGALGFRCDRADSFRIDEPRRPLLWGRLTADPQARRRVAESIWDPVEPQGWTLTFDRQTTANHLADLQIGLDRLACTDVLAPRTEDPLQPDERWRLRVWETGGRRHEVWLGRLRDDGRAVVWSPGDGACLAVPEQILTTLRNLRTYLRPREG